jgi:hypothetical protein
VPFQVIVDKNRKIFKLVGTGSTDTEGYRSAIQSVANHPLFEPGYQLLVDARRLNYTPSASEVHMFAQMHTSIEAFKSRKVAVVVSKIGDYGMANMFAAQCNLSGVKVDTFLSIRAAELWLAG